MNAYSGRPSTDAITDVEKYARLAKAQNRVLLEIAAVAPRALYPKVASGSMPTLTTTDAQVFTFGTDASGYAVFPMGHTGIYDNLDNIPDWPWIEGRDFINEGTQIRIPNNGTFTGTLYWYGIGQPADITAVVQPALLPEASRELIVIEAVRRFAQEYLRNAALVDEMAAEWDRAWPRWALTYRTQFRSGGALVPRTGLQLALLSQI